MAGLASPERNAAAATGIAGHDARMGDAVLQDLADEHAALDAVVTGIDAAAWEAPTPSPGWRVRDQIGHLAYFDQMALVSAIDPGSFAAHLERDE